jgi:hypothetical protein
VIANKLSFLGDVAYQWAYILRRLFITAHDDGFDRLSLQDMIIGKSAIEQEMYAVISNWSELIIFLMRESSEETP